jgi:hypothetical protein
MLDANASSVHDEWQTLGKARRISHLYTSGIHRCSLGLFFRFSSLVLFVRRCFEEESEWIEGLHVPKPAFYQRSTIAKAREATGKARSQNRMAPSRSMVSIELLFTVIFVFFRSSTGVPWCAMLSRLFQQKDGAGIAKKYTSKQENMTTVRTGIPRGESDPISRPSKSAEREKRVRDNLAAALNCRR